MTRVVEEIELRLDNSDFVKKTKQSKVELKSIFDTATKAISSYNAVLDKAIDKARLERIKEMYGEKASVSATKANEGLTSSFIKANLAAAALTKTLSFVVDNMRAGLENARAYETSTMRLTTTLRMQGIEGDRAIDVFNKQAAALQDLTGTSDDVIRSMQSQAMSMGIAAKDTDKLIRASFSLSKIMGTSVNESMRQLAKTTSGLAEETVKLIPGVASMTEEQLRSGQVIDLVAEKYGHLAGRPMESMITQLDLATEAIGDFFEALIVSASSEGTMTKFFGNMAQEIKNITFAVSDEKSSLWDFFFDPVALQQRRKQAETISASVKETLAAAGTDAGAIDFGGKGASPTAALFEVGGKKRKGRFDFEGEAGVFADDAMVAGSFQTMLLEQEQAIADQRMEIRMSNMERRAELEQLETEYILEETRRRYDELGQIEAQRAEVSIAIAQGASEGMQRVADAAFSGIADISASYIEAMITGQEFAWKEAADAFLKQTGRQLISSGVRHGLEATALGILSWGTNPQAYALGALAATEVTAGVGMLAGSLAIPDAKGGGGGRAGRSSRGGPSSFTGGMGSRRGGDGEGGGKTVNVTFNGPTTAVEVGIAIKQAIAESERAGF